MNNNLFCLHGITVALTLLLTACGGAHTPEPDVRPVRTLTVAAGNVGDQVNYTGEIRSRYESDLGFRIGGKLVSRPVDVGTQVAAGVVLAQLDPSDQRLAVGSAQSAVVAAGAEFERAKSEEARYRDLLERGLATRSTYIAQQTATKTAQSRLQQAQADASLHNQQLVYATLRSDKAGVVTRVFVDAGAVVAPGQPVVTLAQPSALEVVFDVAEAQVDAVRRTETVQVALLSARDKPFVGRVREVSPSADPVTRTYRVKTTLVDPPSGLSLGMNAVVTLKSNETKSDIVIPATALFEQNRQPAVWIVSPDQALELRPIGIERFDTNDVVVSSGLKPGDRIVTAGVHQLLAGQKVRMLQEPSQ